MCDIGTSAQRVMLLHLHYLVKHIPDLSWLTYEYQNVEFYSMRIVMTW